MIEARGLTKRYGTTTAVDDLSFRVEPGRVTGFLGPNGAGKSTTMRLVLGLDRADAGGVRIGGKRLVDFSRPMREVGALLDAAYVHPTRTAGNHLWALAASNGLPRKRVGAVLGLVGLEEVAGKRVGGFSLGMKQRLGLAAAMLGDPQILLFDEPANGLDPEGIQWMRHFLKGLADEGRTIFVSSHLLSEMALIADDLVVVGLGRLIYQGSVTGFMDQAAKRWVVVRTPEAERLATALAGSGAQVHATADPQTLQVVGTDTDTVGRTAHELGVMLLELSRAEQSLEEAFLQVTAGAQQFRAAGAHTPAAAAPQPPPPPPPSSGGAGEVAR